MYAQDARPSLNRPESNSEWESMREEFHILVGNLSETDLKRKTLDTRWSVGEILEHMVQSLALIPQEIVSVRKGKDFMNLPISIVGAGNWILIKLRARHATPQSLLARYDRAFTVAVQAWENVREDEWAKGAHFYGEGYCTLANNLALAPSHFREHAGQIQTN